jgi:TrmH RNA methyltransferase
MKTNELKLCGLTTVKARFARDAASIKRLYFDYETGRKIGVICKALAAAKKIYRCVEPPELEKIAGTVHHGGIVAVVDAPALRAPLPAEVAAWARRGEPWLLLDHVGNAHNLGALARSAAFFGVPRIAVPNHPDAALPGESAFRVAEGGLEAVEVFRVPDLPRFANELAAAGYEVVGAATQGAGRQRGGDGRREMGDRKPVALALGNEERGLTEAVARACTRLVTIPASGKIESLNVSVAGAVLMWELLARRDQSR